MSENLRINEFHDKQEKKSPLKKFKMPHAFVILLMIALFSAVLTWIIPGGQYERVTTEINGRIREVVVQGTFEYAESTPTTPYAFMKTIFDGMIHGGDIIFSIIFSAGYVAMLIKSGALYSGVGVLLRKLGNKDHWIIPVFMVLFGLGGSMLGMITDVFGFIPAFIAIAMMLNYDKIVGGSIVYLGASVGFAAATVNPFTVVIASAIADVPLTDPKMVIIRIMTFIVFVGITTGYVLRYAKKIKNSPESGLLYGQSHEDVDIEGFSREELMKLEFTGTHALTMVVFLGVLATMVYQLVVNAVWLDDIATIFLIGTVITGLINKYTFSEICDVLIKTTETRAYTMLSIGVAYSIGLVLSNAGVIDTIVYGLGNFVASMPSVLGAVGMLVVQNIINFFIPSGSGQAIVTMPIMVSIADISSVSRELAIIAYQYGDGFSNMFLPSNVAIVAGVMAIPMEKWYKFVAPLFGVIFATEVVIMISLTILGV